MQLCMDPKVGLRVYWKKRIAMLDITIASISMAQQRRRSMMKLWLPPPPPPAEFRPPLPRLKFPGKEWIEILQIKEINSCCCCCGHISTVVEDIFIFTAIIYPSLTLAWLTSSVVCIFLMGARGLVVAAARSAQSLRLLNQFRQIRYLFPEIWRDIEEK